MRAVFALTVALMCGLALAGSNEADTESEVNVPTLPGLGSGCLPTYAKRNYRDRKWHKQPRTVLSYGGQCVADVGGSCPAEQQEHGYCAGINVVCCKNGANAGTQSFDAALPQSSPATTVLRAGATACASAGGVCQTTTCSGTTRSGLCPGAAANVCCFTNVAPPARSLTTLIPIPAGINAGLTIAFASFQTSKLGSPGCPLTSACFSCSCPVRNTKLSNNIVTQSITPTVRITGVKAFVDAVGRAMAAVKAAGATRPELLDAYNQLRTAGGLCCRPIKRSDGSAGGAYSNHSWGIAVDFYFGNTIDPRGDGKTQYGLSLIAPFFNAEKLYWAAGFRGSEEDAMHFESSQESLNSWIAQKLIK